METPRDCQFSGRAGAYDSARLEEARRGCVFAGRQPRCRDGQEAVKMACSHYADAVGFLDEADEGGHALETWSDAAAQYWANVERQGRSHLTGCFATFHLRAVLGETRMPMDCVILAGGGNAELRSWKAFGQWVKLYAKRLPEHPLRSTRKIVAFIQGTATPSKKVMGDLCTEKRTTVVLKFDGDCRIGQSL